MATETRAFDEAKYLKSSADQADLLSAAVADGDPRYFAAALDAVTRACARSDSYAANRPEPGG